MNNKYIHTLVILIAFTLGILAGRYIFPQFKEVKSDPKIVYVKGDATTQTIIKYVPKENGENTDVQIDINKPKIDVKVNDKEYVLQPNFDEQNIFDNGKLLFTQNSNFSLDIKLPEPKRRLELGGYLLNNSFGGTAVIPRKNGGSYIPMLGTTYDFQKFQFGLGITF